MKSRKSTQLTVTQLTVTQLRTIQRDRPEQQHSDQQLDRTLLADMVMGEATRWTAQHDQWRLSGVV